MPKKSENESSAFKNWINDDVVNRIAINISAHKKDFPKKDFQKVTKTLAPLELKARIQVIREALKQTLPIPYPLALSILLQATQNPTSEKTALKGFALWPFTDFIQTYGLQDRDLSLKALEQLTPIFTAEFAVRPFIIYFPEQTYRFLLQATNSKNEHIRRWASEGSRPRLPWGEQLKFAAANPAKGIQILERLKYDESFYVRKSVANHLNDISKDHPATVLKLVNIWIKTAPDEHKFKINWIVRHSLRTLLKQGNLEALKILGFKGQIQLKNLRLSKSKVKIGESFELEFEIKATKKTKVMVDYILHHQKSNGKTTPKVFKLAVKELQSGETIKIRKKHSFKFVTTRIYYPGTHQVEIMVNGQKLQKKKFQLIP